MRQLYIPIRPNGGEGSPVHTIEEAYAWLDAREDTSFGFITGTADKFRLYAWVELDMGETVMLNFVRPWPDVPTGDELILWDRLRVAERSS